MVCSAVVLGCTLTRCDRVEIPVPTALSPTHHHTHTHTHTHTLPTPPHRAQTPLAVYFRHSTSSARRQNHKPSMSPPLFTLPQKPFPWFPSVSDMLLEWDTLRNIPLCNGTFSYVHPPGLARRLLSSFPLFLSRSFFVCFFFLSFNTFLLVGWLPETMNQGDSHSGGTSRLTFAAVTV